jgi:hypothetical protein
VQCEEGMAWAEKQRASGGRRAGPAPRGGPNPPPPPPRARQACKSGGGSEAPAPGHCQSSGSIGQGDAMLA